MATPDAVNHTINIEVAYGTVVTELTPTIILSSGATISPTSGTAQDFTNPVIYSVTAQDGTTAQDWTVTVTVATNTANDITAFSFPQQFDIITPDIFKHTIDITVDFGTSLNSLVADFTLSNGATATISGTNQVSGTSANDFSSPVTYLITAGDGTTTQPWIVNVTVALNNTTNIEQYSLPNQIGFTTYNTSELTVNLVVPDQTNLTNLIATFVLSEGASATVGGTMQSSGVTANDFTNTVEYLLTAQDGTSQEIWTVNVSKETSLSNATDITAFSLAEQTGSASIGSGTIDIEVAYGTVLTALVPTFSLSSGATARVSATTQVSGITANDFSSQVTYIVTAQDGTTTENWTVTVTVATAPILEIETIPSSVDTSQVSNIIVDVQDNDLFSSIYFLYRGISKGSAAPFISKVTTNTGGTLHSATFTGDEDLLGIEFKFRGNYTSGGFTETEVNYINIYHPGKGLTVPADRVLFSETNANDYRIISIPLNLLSKNSNAVFDELGQYNTDWKLYSFTPTASSTGGDFHEQSTGGISMQLGSGYFILGKTNVTITTGAGETAEVTPFAPAEIQIKQGWNLIGNPYNFSIEWTDILDANTDVANIDQLSTQLKVWLGSYANTQNYLLSFQGGFVFSAEDMTIKIPVTMNVSSPGNGGRLAGGRIAHDPPEWLATFGLNDDKGELSQLKVGMHQNALTGYDKYDQVSLPTLITRVAMKIMHPEFFVPSFSSDLAPLVPYYEWEVALDNFEEDLEYTLDWQIEGYEQMNQSLVLYDLLLQKRINMNEVSSYTFKAKKDQRFKVFFGDQSEINRNLKPHTISLGNAYPNPVNDRLFIPITIPELNNGMNVDVSLYSIQGKRICTILNDAYPSGFHQLQWDRLDNNNTKVQSGVYFIRMKIGATIQTKKIILE